MFNFAHHRRTGPTDPHRGLLLLGRVAFRQNLGFSQEPIKHLGVAFSTLPDFLSALPDSVFKHGVGRTLWIIGPCHVMPLIDPSTSQRGVIG